MTNVDFGNKATENGASPITTPNDEKRNFLPEQSMLSGYDSADMIDRTSQFSVPEDVPPDEAMEVKKMEKKRDVWSSKVDFILTIVGFTVDLANIWRFPYLAYQNGGGAFMIPYLTCLLLAVFPLFYLELCLGQFHRLGVISVWRISPLFKGIGYATTTIIFWVGMYYTVVISWGFYYLFHSFTAQLPWSTCNNTFNTESCWNGDPNATFPENVTRVTAATEFFERYVLGVHESTGLHDIGQPNWRLCLTNLMLFLILYFMLWKGIKASGKVVWVTATLPFIILGILLIRGLLLPGALEGVKYFLVPNISKIGDPSVWIQAAVQVFFSAGVGLGSHIAYGSYNEFHNNCYLDCVVTTICNTLSSLFSGIVIFSYLGYMALKQGVEIPDVATEGPGLVFCVYPEAISTLPGAPAWSVAFFAMLIMLGMDSAMGAYESVVTAFVDEHTFFKRHRYGRELFLAIFMFCAYIASIPSLSNGGYYLVTLLDAYAAGLTMLCVGLCELVAVSWFYGLDYFCEDVKAMLGHAPSIYWRFCWKLLSPAFITGLIVVLIMWSRALVLEANGSMYQFPVWTEVLGWLISISSLIMIPIGAVFSYRSQPETTVSKRLAMAISPEWERQNIKNDEIIRRYDCRHWFSMGGKLSCLKPEVNEENANGNVVFEFRPSELKDREDDMMESHVI